MCTSGTMVCTLCVAQCCSWFLAWGDTLHYIQFADYLRLHTKCRAVLQLVCCLGRHGAVYLVCKLSNNLVHMHVQ